MKTKFISLTFVICSFFLISCTENLSRKSTIKEVRTNKGQPATTSHFLGNQVFMAFGTNFETGELIGFNTLNGDKLKPCQTTKESYANNDQLDSKRKCDYQLINSNGEFKVIDYQGKVRRDAIIKTITIATFEGSVCVVGAEVGGGQYTGCYEVEDVCAALNGDPVARQRYPSTYEQYCQ